MALQSTRNIVTISLFCCLGALTSTYSFAYSALNKTVAAGGAHAIVIATDGTVWTWGYNGQGQLNQKNLKHSTTPLKIPAPFFAVSLATGFKHSRNPK
nr:hypothetical protein [Desulfobulbaceae bacterium]